MGSRIVTLTCLLGQCAVLAVAGDGLHELRTEARDAGPFTAPSHWSPPQPAPSPTRSNFHSDPAYADDDEDTFLDGELTQWLTLGAITLAASPFWGPARLVGDDYTSAAYFARYPYQRPVDGYLMLEPVVPRKPRPIAGRAALEYGGDFHDQSLVAGSLVLDTTWRFGLDVAARYAREERGTAHDDLWLGDANIVFRFAQSPSLIFRTGVGFNWLSDDIGQDGGFNFTYAADWFFARPFILSAELDWGELGHASLFHTRAMIGVEWHRAEVYAGYDYLDVGNAQLDAWIAGCRFWF